MLLPTLETQKAISLWAKYLGMGLTTYISIHSLARETFDKERKRLTVAGRRHLVLLIVSCGLTMFTAYIENRIDTKLQAQARTEGDKAFVMELQKSNATLMAKVMPKFEDLYTQQKEVRDSNSERH